MIPVFASTEELLSALKEKYDTDTRIIEDLKKVNCELRSSIFKDEEISKMREEVIMAKEAMYRGFPISKEEDKSIRSWMDRHNKNRHGGSSYEGTLSGRYSYHFTPTTIGTFGTVECDICMNKYKSELSNYKSLRHKEFDKKKKELKLQFDPSFDFQEP